MFKENQVFNAVETIEEDGPKKGDLRPVGVAYLNVAKTGRPYIKVKLDAAPQSKELRLFVKEPKPKTAGTETESEAK